MKRGNPDHLASSATIRKKLTLVIAGSPESASSTAPAAMAKTTARDTGLREAKNITAHRRTGKPTPKNLGASSSIPAPKTSTSSESVNCAISFATADEYVLQRRKIDGRLHFTLARETFVVLADIK